MAGSAKLKSAELLRVWPCVRAYVCATQMFLKAPSKEGGKVDLVTEVCTEKFEIEGLWVDADYEDEKHKEYAKAMDLGQHAHVELPVMHVYLVLSSGTAD